MERLGSSDVERAFPTMSPSFGIVGCPGGENAALKSVLRRLWRSYVDHLGLEDSVAPEGIWAEDAI